MQDLISCLCVTQNRPEFIPWLLWNYERQSYPNRELIIVDSSDDPYPDDLNDLTGIKYYYAPGLNVPAKRNAALAFASGAYITWVDDDDFIHPERLAVLSELVGAQTPVAGSKIAWFVNLFTFEAKQWFDRRGILFASCLVEKDLAASVPFPEDIERGTDLIWREAMLKNPWAFTWKIPTFFVCHDRNMGNVASRHTWNREIGELVSAVGRREFGKALSQLKALRERIASN